jgi:hypothetical protein
MPNAFDPYHKWLGIPPNEQPPNHYRLLGITKFESDPEVIGAAADRQMAHLRTKSSGANADLSQKLLNEVAQARVTLLNPDKRAAYDRTLAQSPAAPPPGPPSRGDGHSFEAPPIPSNQESAINIDVGSKSDIRIAGTEVNPARLKTKGAKKARTGRSNILIIQNTIAIGLAIIALISLWLLYPIIAGKNNDTDGSNDVSHQTDPPDKRQSSDPVKSNKDTTNQNKPPAKRLQNQSNSTAQNRPARILIDLRETRGKEIRITANNKQLSVAKNGYYTLEVPAGKSNVELRRTGYQPVRKAFELRADQAESWQPNWTPGSTLVIDSDGDDIRVKIDGVEISSRNIEDLNTGSKQIRLVPGSYQLTISREGFKPINQAVKLAFNESLVFDGKWEKAASLPSLQPTSNKTKMGTPRDQNYAEFSEHWAQEQAGFGNTPIGIDSKSGVKLPIPSDSEIKSTKEKLRDKVPSITRADLLAQLGVLVQCLENARKETGKTEKYCWLEISKEIAIDAGQPAIAVWIVDHLHRWYETDPQRITSERVEIVNEATRKVIDAYMLSEALNVLAKMFRNPEYRDQLDKIRAVVRKMQSHAKRKRASAIQKDAEDDLRFLDMAVWLYQQEFVGQGNDGTTLETLFAIDSFRDAIVYEQWDECIEDLKKSGIGKNADGAIGELSKIVSAIGIENESTNAAVELADWFWNAAEAIQATEGKHALKTAARYWYCKSAGKLEKARIDQVKLRFAEDTDMTGKPQSQPSIWIDTLQERGWRRGNDISGSISASSDAVHFVDQSGLEFGQFSVPALVLEFEVQFKNPNGSFDVVIGDRRNRRIRFAPDSEKKVLKVSVTGSDGMADISPIEASTAFAPTARISIYLRPGQIDVFTNHHATVSVPFGSDPCALRLQTGKESDLLVTNCVGRSWTKFDEALTGMSVPQFRHDGNVALAAYQYYVRLKNIAFDNSRRGNRPQVATSVHLPMIPIAPNRPVEVVLPAGGQQNVRLSNEYWISEYEITQRQWTILMEDYPSVTTGSPFLPVDQVSYNEVAEFCKRLTLAEAKSGRLPKGMVYRLPTEMEWLFACQRFFPERPNAPPAVNANDDSFWRQETCGGSVQQVGSYNNVQRRVYDMRGNVSEWVLDAWHDMSNFSNQESDPVHLPRSASDWIQVRGGAWWNSLDECQETTRHWSESNGAVGRGFRVVLAPPVGN